MNAIIAATAVTKTQDFRAWGRMGVPDIAEAIMGV